MITGPAHIDDPLRNAYRTQGEEKEFLVQGGERVFQIKSEQGARGTLAITRSGERVEFKNVMCELPPSDVPALSGAGPFLQRFHQITIRDRSETFGIKVLDVERAEGGGFADNFNSVSWRCLFLNETAEREIKAGKKRESTRSEGEKTLQDATADFGRLLPSSRFRCARRKQKH